MRKLILASIGVLLAAADTYVIVLALPEIAVGVGIDADEFQLAVPLVSGFLLGYIAMLPLIGRLSDLLGRPPVLVGSLLVFGFGSLVTASSEVLGEAVAGRFLQGVGGGGLVPVTLALVADLWPPERRGLPLGVVGGVQEFGSLIGPLFGGVVLAFADWRAIFWIYLGCAVLLALGFISRRRTPGRPREAEEADDGETGPGAKDARRGPRDLLGAGLGGLTLIAVVLTIAAPTPLVEDVVIGQLFLPYGSSRLTTPLGIAAIVLLAAFTVRDLTARHPLIGLSRVPGLIRRVDAAGAGLLGLALGGVVIAFAVADPQQEVLSAAGPWLLAGSAVAAAAFIVRERTARYPLIPPGTLRARPAWGAIVISVPVGAGLVAALVDIPSFARATIHPDSHLGATLVLLRFLVAVPVGALLGGLLVRRVPPGPLTAVAMAMATGGFVAMAGWGPQALNQPGATVALVVGGLGFGLAIAPVNAALLAAAPSDAHGVASGLVVVARMVGMLVGLAALTAVALRRFWAAQAALPRPGELCPDSPANCPAYVDALRETALVQLHTVFAGAAVCTAVAALLAIPLLTGRVRLPAGSTGRPGAG